MIDVKRSWTVTIAAGPWTANGTRRLWDVPGHLDAGYAAALFEEQDGFSWVCSDPTGEDIAEGSAVDAEIARREADVALSKWCWESEQPVRDQAALLKCMLRATEYNLATLDELMGRKSSSTRARKRQFSICSDMLITCSSMRESIEWVQGCRHLYSRVEEIFGKGEPEVGLDGAFQRWFKARYGTTEP